MHSAIADSGAENPNHQGECYDRQAGAIDNVKGCRGGNFGPPLGKPIPGEAWDDPAADKADEHEKGGHAEPVVELSRHRNANSVEMDKQLPASSRVSAASIGGEDFAGDDASEY